MRQKDTRDVHVKLKTPLFFSRRLKTGSFYLSSHNLQLIRVCLFFKNNMHETYKA